MAFKMKGFTPYTKSAFKNDETFRDKVGNALENVKSKIKNAEFTWSADKAIRRLTTPGATLISEGLKGVFNNFKNKNKDKAYTKTKSKSRTTQQNLDKKRDLDYKPQSQKK